MDIQFDISFIQEPTPEQEPAAAAGTKEGLTEPEKSLGFQEEESDSEESPPVRIYSCYVYVHMGLQL